MFKRIGFLTASVLSLGLAQSTLAQSSPRYMEEPDPAEVARQQAAERPIESRAWRTEFFAEGGYLHSNGSVQDTSQDEILNINNTLGATGGVGFGYNIGSFINVNVDATIGQDKIHETLSGPAEFARADSSNGAIYREMFNLELYPLKGPITPVLTGGVGAVSTAVDFDVNGAGIQHRQETDFAYCAGGGIRWDVSDDFTLKVIYRANWTKYHNFDNDLLIHGVFISVGFMF